MNEINQENRQRYSRHMMIDGIGEDGQRKLLKSKVFVLGCGALGSISSMYLAGAGIGEITIADFDTVDISNLQRQLTFSINDLGKPKAEILAKRMSSLNPDIKINAINGFINRDAAQKLIENSDFVIEGSDNPDTKYMVDEICSHLGKPYCLAGVNGMEGQLITHIPGSALYSDIFPIPHEISGYTPCSVGGVLGALPGIMGSIQAAEAIKYITGTGELFINRLLTVDLRSCQLHSIDV